MYPICTKMIERLTFEKCLLITLLAHGKLAKCCHTDRYRQDLANTLAKCDCSLTKAIAVGQRKRPKFFYVEIIIVIIIIIIIV